MSRHSSGHRLAPGVNMGNIVASERDQGEVRCFESSVLQCIALLYIPSAGVLILGAWPSGRNLRRKPGK
jgi:hypothetical protein